MYHVSVAIHVAAAIVGFGATFTYPVIQLAAQRANRRALPFAMDAILAISRLVAVPATIVVGVTGIYQLVAGPYGLHDAWLAVGLGLYLAVMLIGILAFAPAYARAGAAARRMVASTPEGEPVQLSREYRDALRGPTLLGPPVAAATLAIAALMVVKPR